MQYRVKETIRAIASELGFARMGVASADAVEGEQGFCAWLEAGYQGEMDYLSRNVTKRFHPAGLVPGARSVLSLVMSYAPDTNPGEGSAAEIACDRALVARYARGRDYHRVLKNRCRKLMDRVRAIVPKFQARAFVDSAPLAERSLAAAAGVGWIGKNCCLIVPGVGSYVVLCEIVCNLDLPSDSPIENRCGGCDLCLRACPTVALLGDSLLDTGRCLSYLTIEHRGPISHELGSLWGERVFGCDTCQEACPHNFRIPPGDPALMAPRPISTSDRTLRIAETPLGELLGWLEEDWDSATRGSVTRRTPFKSFLRNVILAAACTEDASMVGPLQKLRERFGEFGELIDWAITRLNDPANPRHQKIRNEERN